MFCKQKINPDEARRFGVRDVYPKPLQAAQSERGSKQTAFKQTALVPTSAQCALQHGPAFTRSHTHSHTDGRADRTPPHSEPRDSN